MSYCIVTKWEDGTVSVTALDVPDPSPEELGMACWLVAAEVESPEGSPDKGRIHLIEGTLPHYQVCDDPAAFDADEVYAVDMGVVRIRRQAAPVTRRERVMARDARRAARSAALRTEQRANEQEA